MNESAPTDDAQQPKQRPWVPICVATGNRFLVKVAETGTPPARIMLPWTDPNDRRLFVRNGELVSPYGVVEFAFIGLASYPELDHDLAVYKELVRTDFDPSDCVEIKYFDMDKLAAKLNAQ